ncbi:chemotaxis protein CheD [Desulfonatronum parangueonense]
MNSAHFANYPVFHLQIGECFLSREPTLVCTVLGSCVAVSFFEPMIRLGGIFHALLPDSPANDEGASTTQPCRFVDQSIQRILLAVERNGGRRRDIQIKVFGGAELFGFSGGTGSVANSVGRKNVRTAIVELEKAGLRIMASDVGGALGRKLYFLSDTGEVWVKRIQRTLFSD